MGFGPGDLASLLLDAARGRGRRWQGNGRLHVSAQAPPAGSAAEAAFAAAVRQILGEHPGVNWARWNAATRRVVIDGPATQGETEGGSEGETAVLLERLAELEHRLDGVAATPTPDHPADLEPILRSIAEIVAELAGTGLGLALQNRPGRRQLGIDLAAALRVLETLPPLRASLDRRLGSGTAELLLRLADSLDYALLRGLAGPLVGLLEEGLRLRARLQHRRRWQQVEAAWNARPQDHPEQGSNPGPRPRPLPDGPIERYGQKATLISLASAGGWRPCGAWRDRPRRFWPVCPGRPSWAAAPSAWRSAGAWRRWEPCCSIRRRWNALIASTPWCWSPACWSRSGGTDCWRQSARRACAPWWPAGRR